MKNLIPKSEFLQLEKLIQQFFKKIKQKKYLENFEQRKKDFQAANPIIERGKNTAALYFIYFIFAQHNWKFDVLFD